jgi:hypothetical protein
VRPTFPVPKIDYQVCSIDFVPAAILAYGVVDHAALACETRTADFACWEALDVGFVDVGDCSVLDPCFLLIEAVQFPSLLKSHFLKAAFRHFPVRR